MGKTKAELEVENAGLRELLAAISETARSAPMAAADVPDRKELMRAQDMLRVIAVITEPHGSWTWGWANGRAASYLRKQAAEPVGYAVYVPEPEQNVHNESVTTR